MKWTSSFKYLPINYGMTLATLSDKTQRVLFDNNLNGNKVRILFSNKYAKETLNLKQVTTGIANEGAVERIREVTLRGTKEIVLPAGAEVYSDEVEVTVKAGDRIAVNIYIDQQQKIQNLCGYWAEGGSEVRCNIEGDDTRGNTFSSTSMEEIYKFVKEDPSSVKGQFFFGFSAVQVWTEDDVKVITAFGDSITAMAFFTNALQKRLYKKYPGQVTLLNAGIGGNRLLHDATWIPDAPAEGGLFGEAGVRRFEKDVFGRDKVDSIFCLMGINDIMHPLQFEKAEESVSAEYLEQGFSYLAKKAHDHGSRIYGATIMPCGNTEYSEKWMQAFEKTRRDVNQWIRTQSVYDGYFDFDDILKNDTVPAYLKEEVHIGDGLHPNTMGGKILAECVDLSMLTGLDD